MVFQFGSFNGVCKETPLSLCPYVGTAEGIEPVCYARNVEIGGSLIFQPSTLIIDLIALLMTAIMIIHIKSKYTAVGRKEIVMFFYLYTTATLLEIFLISGIIPTASIAYPYFAALHVGIITATFWCLLLNGFVGFQFAEDGTPMSLWFIRLTSSLVCVLAFFIAAATFNGWAGFDRATPLALWIVYFIFNGAALFVYLVLQIVLVVNTLDDPWPLGDILFGALFFILGQVFLYFVSRSVCSFANHYIDGLFFSTICNLLAVMMVYKYWDSITKEDLEFSIGGGRQNVWEVKELLDESDDYGGSGGDIHQGYSGVTFANSSHSQSHIHTPLQQQRYYSGSTSSTPSPFQPYQHHD